MFRIDRSCNRITRLQEVNFSDLEFRERTHLQEWLANQPNHQSRANAQGVPNVRGWGRNGEQE